MNRNRMYLVNVFLLFILALSFILLFKPENITGYAVNEKFSYVNEAEVKIKLRNSFTIAAFEGNYTLFNEKQNQLLKTSQNLLLGYSIEAFENSSVLLNNNNMIYFELYPETNVILKELKLSEDKTAIFGYILLKNGKINLEVKNDVNKDGKFYIETQNARINFDGKIIISYDEKERLTDIKALKDTKVYDKINRKEVFIKKDSSFEIKGSISVLNRILDFFDDLF